MDDRSFYFLEVMLALGGVGIIAFLIFLVARFAQGAASADGPETTPVDGHQPHWVAFLLAAALLIIVVGLVTWQFFAQGQGVVAESDWRDASRSIIFTVVMLAGGGLGLIVFVVFIFARAQSGKPASSPFEFVASLDDGGAAAPAATGPPAPEGGSIQTPSAIRLVGLLGLALAILLLNWIYLDAARQYQLMVSLVYPAAFVVAMVLLFDKATRAWSPKPAVEIFREWLLCNGLTILLILGYLNLLELGDPKKYHAMFWDMLHVFAFLMIFWLLDRKLSRYRFLVTLGYLVLLPILYLLWRFFQDLAIVEGIPFWSSLWPFFILAGIFFVLEIIALIATRASQHQLLPTLKDALFVVIYFFLLIIAIPAAPE